MAVPEGADRAHQLGPPSDQPPWAAERRAEIDADEIGARIDQPDPWRARARVNQGRPLGLVAGPQELRQIEQAESLGRGLDDEQPGGSVRQRAYRFLGRRSVAQSE